jgi:hypothetical protein
MIISPSKLTADLQNEFSAKYPLLQIRFYTAAHEHFEGSPVNEEVIGDKKLNELNASIKEGNIDISETTTPDKLESEFEENFGLHVQVFRKSGAIWLQTSKTDFWPLSQHQQKAEETV